MKLIFDPKGPIEYSTTATIGNFDGVHVGHKKIIDLVRNHARENGQSSCVITFHPHPQKVIKDVDIPLLVPLEERFKLLDQNGIDLTVCFTFTKELSNISAEDFIRDILVEKLGVRSIFIGPDFAFGKGRGGNPQLLREMGKELGFDTEVVEPVFLNGEQVSSTAIRRFVQEGMVKKSAKFLGKQFYLEGEVKEGERRGREIGFPTANLSTDWEILPKRGVYVTWAVLNGERFRSITNIGVRPTFGETRLLVETHIFDFSRNIYRKHMRVEFVERLRDEKKFESVDALVAEIKRDKERAKEIFSSHR